MAMVKAFAYGAGSYDVARFLEYNGVEYLSVAYTDEGVNLRQSGISLPIMVLNPETSGYQAMIRNNLEPQIYSFRTLKAFNEALLKFEFGEGYPVHIMVNTGMNRLGFEADEIDELIEYLIQKDHIKIAYRTGERFTNELITAIRNGATHQFREQYRKVDVLIIDDVQFIAGKTSTQEEFFHTFNALHEVHKQIILVSDRSPREMSHLEERLRSRFNWGLVADIQPPNLETRLAILASKAELAGVSLDREVSYLLASRITNNVRELEGALTRLTAYARLTDRSIDMDMARHVLRDQLQEEIRTVSVDDIQKGVANYYNISIKEMLSKKRTRTVAFPRQIAMYACKELTSLSLPEIGEKFGGKDHTTILYAHRKIDKMRNEDRDFDDEIKRLISLLKP